MFSRRLSIFEEHLNRSILKMVLSVSRFNMITSFMNNEIEQSQENKTKKPKFATFSMLTSSYLLIIRIF
jgi:hypothetical protein